MRCLKRYYNKRLGKFQLCMRKKGHKIRGCGE